MLLPFYVMLLRSFLRLLPQLVQIVDPALPQRMFVARLGRQHQGVFQIIAEVLREFLRPRALRWERS